jgi:hypothetical protein
LIIALEHTIIAARARCEVRDFVIARVAGDAGENADAELIEQRLDLPQLAGEIVFADDVDVVGRRVFRLLGADHVSSSASPAELVAEVLRADKPGALTGITGLPNFLAAALQTAFDVVADHGRDAGLVDEDRRRIVFLDDLLDRLVEPLLAAEDDVELVDVGGEAGAIRLRAGRLRAAVVPGIALAGDRAVHQMGDIGDRLQRDLGAVEGAAAGRARRAQLLGAALLAFLLRFSLVLAAAGSLNTSWILADSELISLSS